MKQETSVLKWASLLLEQQVRTLDSIQNVGFIKRMLFRIDPDQFSEWESGKGTENYAHVLSEIEKYFKNELQTDIRHHIDRLNVYKNPMEVWQLLLGIAIKGNKRSENITLILDMDHNVQAELVGIVSNIIDKFGQNAAASSINPIDEDPNEQEEHDGNQQMFMEIVKENEELNQQLDELQAEIERLRQEKNMISKQKKEVENELAMLKNEKTAFIQILANENRTESRIFDDGEQTVLHSPSLSELANDLTIFVRNLKRKFAEEQEKTALLEESLREARIEAAQCAQENQSYLLQMGNLNAYEYEIEKMREEMNQIFDENSDLIERVNNLEEERSRLLLELQIKTRQTENPQSNQTGLKNSGEFINVKRRRQNAQGGWEKGRGSVQSNDSAQSADKPEVYVSEVSSSERHQIKDELREPKLRNKLQREIEYLKKSNESLKKQNTTLKLSNESLQRSANDFMLSNKEIVSRWEEDYQELVSKMNQLTQASITKGDEQILFEHPEPPKMKVEIYSFQEVAGEPIFHEDLKNQAQVIATENPLPVNEAHQDIRAHTFEQKESLWQDIASKLRNIIRKGKERQFSLQNTIHSLRAENQRLLGLNRDVNQFIQANTLRSSSRKSSFQAPIKKSNDSEIKINEINSGDELKNEDMKRMAKLSFLSIREGEDLEDEAVEKRRSEGLSGFYNMGSKIMEGITENKPQPSEIGSNNDLYLNINRALFKSTQSNLHHFREMESAENTVQSSELEERLKRQIQVIQEHYQQLNSSYQEVFQKLQLYSEQFSQAEVAKQEYQKIIEQLKVVEEEVRADQQAEIIKLRIVNDQLQKGLSQAAAEKQFILQEVNQIIKLKDKNKSIMQQNYEENYQTMLKALEEIKLKYKEIMIEPLEFLQIRLEGSKQGQLQKFYKMYLKEKEKCRQLTAELELLSGVLLEYNTIIHC